MRLKNTSGIDSEIVREVVRFVRPSGIANFDVMVRKSKKQFHGRAYWNGSGYHATASPFVVVRVGSNFPYKTKDVRYPGKGYLPMGWLYNRVEALVMVMAHELRHMWQAKHKKGYRVWGSKGQFSERDADAYALRKLREWRKEHGVSR